jgi:hypothetical protein
MDAASGRAGDTRRTRMRIGRRNAGILALTATVAVGAVGIATAAPDGNSSSLKGSKIAPSKLPKKRFKKATLFVHTHTDYADAGNKPQGGFVRRTQIFFDDDGMTNPKGIAKCPGDFSSNTTLKQAMHDCGKAKVGTGTATATSTGSDVIPGCVLIFNGTPHGDRPTVIIFTRVTVPGPADCSSPSTNTTGSTSVTLTGVLKKTSGDFGTILDVNNIDASPLPLTDFNTKTHRGKYITARCHDKNHKLDIKGKFTYTDGQSDTVHTSQRCRVA